MSQTTQLEKLEQFKFNLGHESLMDKLIQKETINKSLSEFVVEESIKQLSDRISETNDHVKSLQETMNSLLMQQIQLQKQLIDHVSKNSSMLERVLSLNSTASIETPASQPIVASSVDHVNHAITKRKSRLTFTQRKSEIIKEEIEKESDLFEDFII